MVKTAFIRRRDGFASSALKAFLACAAAGFTPTERQTNGLRPLVDDQKMRQILSAHRSSNGGFCNRAFTVKPFFKAEQL